MDLNEIPKSANQISAEWLTAVLTLEDDQQVSEVVVEDLPAGGGFMGNTPTMPDACVPALFIIATIAIAGMVVQTKSREPGV